MCDHEAPAILGTMNRAKHNVSINRVLQWWNGLTLLRQFTIAGSAVLLAGMLVIGFWLTGQIRRSVMHNAAVTTALYVDSVIAPLLPDLRNASVLGEGPRRALDETLSQGALGRRLVAFKIWRKGGLILYSTEPALIGRRFTPTKSLNVAWAGSVAAELDELSDDENVLERSAGLPLLEIYSPIREPWSGEVLAVAEFYEVASDLKRNLAWLMAKSWLVVAAETLAMLALLSGIVREGGRTIASQRATLQERVDQLSELLAQNEALRMRVQESSRRAVGLNERFLRKVSADLHDGPAQLVALAALRMGSDKLTAGAGAEGANDGEIARIRKCLDDAIGEIRAICTGLALPNIEAASTPELITLARDAHAQRTATRVELELPDYLPDLATPEKICVFRFIQEALNNAFHHADGKGQAIAAQWRDGELSVSVCDAGPGFDADAAPAGRLGLAGLSERVESLGGRFDVESSSLGTRLTITLNIRGQSDR